jgi:hypothetical protein
MLARMRIERHRRLFVTLALCAATLASAQAAPRGDRISVNELNAFLLTQQARLRQDARPVPPRVRDRMARYFPAATLARARFVVAPAAVSKASAVLGNPALQAAVFFDLIAFKSDADTNDLALWASQLQHVRMQVERGNQGALADWARPVKDFNDQTAAIERLVSKELAGPSTTTAAAPARARLGSGEVPKGTQFMVHNCKADALTCELAVFMVQAPGETIPCSCRDSFGMSHQGTAF